MTPLAVAIFVASYVLIALRRVPALPIGRAAGALLGAVATVAFGVLSPERALASIDGATLVLLVAMMLLSGYLERSGLFERLEGAAQRACPTPRRLLLGVALAPGLLSAFLLNDAVCLFLAGPLVRLCARHRLPPAPYLLALATSANLGSAATLVGNPQNMIVGSLSGYGFVPFLRAVGPAALAGLLVNAALLLLAYGRGLPARFADAAESPRSDGPRPVLALLVTLGIAVGLLCDFDLGFTVLAGVMVLVIADRREPTEALARVDLSLLVFFSGLFVVVAGLESTGLVRSAWESLAGRLGTGSPSGLVLLSGLLTVGSNLVSNVPMVLLTGPHLAALGDPERAWALVAFVTTVAGNLTLVGSVANLIVAERAREHYDLGFVEYLRFGVVSTTIVLAVGVPLVCWTTAG